MQHNRFKNLSIIFLGVLLLSGCASPKEMYYWGGYENLIYDTYINPGKAEATVQIETLTTDIQQAENNGKQVPPGVYAQLGMVYSSQGQSAQAEAALLEEKKLYPESAQFINGLIERASKEKSK